MTFWKLTKVSVVASVFSVSLQAQEQNFAALQENITIFAGVLEDSLELTQNTGLFGMQLGGVDSRYLVDQGAVFEIRTPLATKRNRISLSSLSSAMQNLQARSASAPVSAMSTNLAASSSPETASLYDEMMEKVTSVDYSIIMNTAVQQASDAARSLRNLGSVDGDEYAQIQQDLDAMRNTSQQTMNEIRSLTSAIESTQAEDASSAESSSMDLRANFDDLLAQVEPLKQQAMAKAAELMQKSEQAQKEFAANLESEITSFESKVFESLCNYGGTLRELPANERISLVFDGLGDSSTSNEKADKIFVIEKRDVERCMAGSIDAASLAASAISYTY